MPFTRNARVYRYNLRDAATANGGASGVSTRGAPCKGASAVILRFKSTDAADTLTAAAYNVSNDPAAGYLAGAAQGFTSVGSVNGFRMDRGNGLTILVLPSLAHGFFHDSYIQATFTAAGATPANDISGFSIEAEVIYYDGLDEAFGQTMVTI